MNTVKKVAAAILAIVSAASFHDFCLTLVADVAVSAGSLRRDAIGLAFFAAVALGAAAGAAKLWGRWRIPFGLTAIATALVTAQLMMMRHPAPALTARDKAAAYVTMALVAAVGAIALIWTPRRSDKSARCHRRRAAETRRPVRVRR